MGAHENRIQMHAGEGAHLGWRMRLVNPDLPQRFNLLVLLFVPWGYPKPPPKYVEPPNAHPCPRAQRAHLTEK